MQCWGAGGGGGAPPPGGEVPPPSCGGDMSLEVDFTGTFDCYEQAPAFFRDRGRVDEDARRFYQNGHARGSITVGDNTIASTPAHWSFRRHHPWGVRRGSGGGDLPQTSVLQPRQIPEGVLYFMGIFEF